MGFLFFVLDDSNNGYQSLAFNLNHPKYFPGSNMITFHFVGDDAVKIESQERGKTKSDLNVSYVISKRLMDLSLNRHTKNIHRWIRLEINL